MIDDAARCDVRFTERFGRTRSGLSVLKIVCDARIITSLDLIPCKYKGNLTLNILPDTNKKGVSLLEMKTMNDNQLSHSMSIKKGWDSLIMNQT